MKCDELKAGVIVTPHDEGMCFDIGPDVIAVTERETEFYLKSDVDAAIDELKGQVNGFKNRANLWEYNAQNEHNAAVTVRMENAKLKAKLAEKDKKIAELKDQYKDMDVTHTVHIAKMNARIEELEENVDFCKKEIRRLKRALWLARGYIMTLLQRDFQRLAYQCNNGDYKKNLLNRRNRYYDLYEKCRAKAEEYK